VATRGANIRTPAPPLPRPRACTASAKVRPNSRKVTNQIQHLKKRRIVEEQIWQEVLSRSGASTAREVAATGAAEQRKANMRLVQENCDLRESVEQLQTQHAAAMEHAVRTQQQQVQHAAAMEHAVREQARSRCIDITQHITLHFLWDLQSMPLPAGQDCEECARTMQQFATEQVAGPTGSKLRTVGFLCPAGPSSPSREQCKALRCAGVALVDAGESDEKVGCIADWITRLIEDYQPGTTAVIVASGDPALAEQIERLADHRFPVATMHNCPPGSDAAERLEKHAMNRSSSAHWSWEATQSPDPDDYECVAVGQYGLADVADGDSGNQERFSSRNATPDDQEAAAPAIDTAPGGSIAGGQPRGQTSRRPSLEDWRAAAEDTTAAEGWQNDDDEPLDLAEMPNRGELQETAMDTAS